MNTNLFLKLNVILGIAVTSAIFLWSAVELSESGDRIRQLKQRVDKVEQGLAALETNPTALRAMGVSPAAKPKGYTATIECGGETLTFTNVVEYPHQHAEACILVRYADYGSTNEFHAWLVPVSVSTNY